MAESDESRSFASISVESDSVDAVDQKQREIYSLIITVKSLALDDVRQDAVLELRLTFGDSVVVVSGTLAEINEQRRGSSIGIPVTNPEEFKRFLMDHNLHVVIKKDSIELGKTSIQLSATNLNAFEPSEFEPTIVSEEFPLERKSTSVGRINLVLKTDRIKTAAVGPNIEEDSFLYIVNDTPQRRSIEYQDDTMKQLLMCNKCNVAKSPSEMSYQYELIDGILVNREHTRKDPDLETMKQKIEQLEREAKLYPVGQKQEPLKENTDSRFCNSCGGYSITGATCVGWQRPTAMPLFNSENGYPEGSTKRFVEGKNGGKSENGMYISEPNFAYSGDSRSRLNQTCFESYPQPVSKPHGANLFCPKTVGSRFCQRCGVNMDWLPLHSSCPKCGFKAFPLDLQTTLFPMQHEIAPSRLDSWMGSFELAPQPQSRQPSAGTIRSASLEAISCPLCHLRGRRCPDCANRTSTVRKENLQPTNCTIQSSTSDSEMLSRKVIERPKTRPSLRDRFGGFPKRIDKATRVSELFQAYGGKTVPTRDSKSSRSTRSSIVSLDVDKILQKTEAYKKKTSSGGVPCIELRKINPSYGLDNECPNLSPAQIRKNQRSLLDHIKKQNRGRYSYQHGNQYPGIVVGHRECNPQGSSVPPHMGWLWNIKTLGIGRIRRGWRPGAVRKPIKELMQHFLASYPLDNFPVSRKANRRLKISENDYDKLKQKPTLQIVKRNGEYCIVMNPLKDSQSLKTAQDPYLPCEPIRFKLAKYPNTGKLYQLRQALKVKGFTMCGCKEFESCDHKSDKEKKLLQKELKKLSKCLGLPKSTGLKDIPSGSESELDLEFTPPSAMLKSGVRKPDVVCTETQYCVDDYKVLVPADKLKCQPGPEQGNDVGRETRIKIGDSNAMKDKGGKPGTRGTGGILKSSIKNTAVEKSEIVKKTNTGAAKMSNSAAAKGDGGKSAMGTKKVARGASK